MKIAFQLLSIIVFSVFVACKTQPKMEQSVADASLTNTRWKLIELDGKAVIATEKDVVMTLRLESNKIDGFAGCNSFSGTYSVEKNVLKASDLATTRRMCPQMELETQFLKVLSRNPVYRIQGDTLTLLADGQKMAIFAALYLN